MDLKSRGAVSKSLSKFELVNVNKRSQCGPKQFWQNYPSHGEIFKSLVDHRNRMVTACTIRVIYDGLRSFIDFLEFYAENYPYPAAG